MHRTLEVPLDSLEAATIAAPYADRLELCDDLSTEGWTPDMALVREARALVEGTRTEIVSMIRPRSANLSAHLDVAAFATTPQILADSLREIEASARAGAHSVGIGLLTPDGHVDLEACGRMVALARECGMATAFLRTFDLLSDRARGMADLTALGITRVLTAAVPGWDASVRTVAERVAEYRLDVDTAARVAAARGVAAVEVVMGGGVRAVNAPDFLMVSPHLHASCRRDGRISAEELSAIRSVLDAG